MAALNVTKLLPKQNLRFNFFIVWFLLATSIVSGTATAVTNVKGVIITRTVPSLNNSTQTYDSFITLTNSSKNKPIHGPLALQINSISRKGVSVDNPAGKIKNKPYMFIPLSNGLLSPQQTLGNITVRFNNPTGKPFKFSTKVITQLPDINPTLPNHLPVAHAGTDQTVSVGNTAQLDGSTSTDPEGQPLSYQWTLLKKPQTSNALIGEINKPVTNLSIDQPGQYQLQLIVNDGQIASFPDIVLLNTDHSAPVANAGLPKTVPQRTPLTLDSSASHDSDGQPLTHAWTLPRKPGGSKAKINPNTAESPTLTLDKKGNYTAQVIVSDGQNLSEPAIVNLSTHQSMPVANAGANIENAPLNQPISLSASLSSDSDHETLSYHWSLLYKPNGSAAILSTPELSECQITPDLPGDYIAQLIVNDGHFNSAPDTVLIKVSEGDIQPVNQAPKITSMSATTASVEKLYTYDVDASDADSGDILSYALTASPAGMSINSQTGMINWTPNASQVGSQAITVNVTDGKGGSDSQSFTINVSATDQIKVPNLVDQSRSSAEAGIQQAKLNIGALTFQHNNKADGSVITQSPAAGSSVKIGTVVNLTVSIGPNNGLPPNPATVAPTIDPTVATNTYDATKFLYTGPNAVQTGMQASTINPKLVAVVQGKVLGKDNQALPGVTISVNGHPEYGQTLSRADGKFDLVVNGGEYLAINYAKQNYLPAQRQQRIPLRDYSLIDEVVLIKPDSTVSPIDLSKNDSFQIAQSSVVTDASGNRQVTILFPQGTGASMLLADGSTQPLSSMHVRATEYTVGSNGPEAMPGALPPTVAYTYAVELSVDEAIAAGAQQVSFSNPVPLYVDNFLRFPTGTKVPTAYYDFKLNAWSPVNDGQIVKILNINNGRAELDTDGDAVIDNGTALGITETERQKLATLFPVGHSVSRVMLSHFSSWDLNYPAVPEDGAVPPGNEDAKNDDQDKLDNPCEESGSIIECENQILGEHLPISGSNLSLNYRSDRVAGRTSGNALHIPVSGSSIPNVLKAIDVRVSIAGQLFKQRLAPQPNQTLDYIWDGKDSYGRLISGGVKARIDIDYVYNGFFAMPANVERSFGSLTGNTTGVRAREQVKLTQSQIVTVQNVNLKNAAIAGWSLDAHHVYDPTTQTLYLGNGTRQTGVVASSEAIISTIDDENGVWKTKLKSSQEAFSPDGSRFANVSLLCQIFKTNPGEQVPIVFAGEYALKGCESSGNDGPVSSVRLGSLAGITIGPDGSLYFSDQTSQSVRKLGIDGMVRAVTKSGFRPGGFSGDGELAVNAKLNNPFGLAFGPDGSLFIADSNNHRIRQITPDGIIFTVAGTGVRGYSGDGGPALSAQIDTPYSLAFDAEGNLYFKNFSSNIVRKITFSSLPGYTGGEFRIPSKDGKEIYHFDASGRHLDTIDSLTNTVKTSFEYDNLGHLIAVNDQLGNKTSIQRDGRGDPTAIIAPFNQRTQLSVGNNGYLNRVTNPQGESFDMNSTDDGLLTRLTDPLGSSSQISYDDKGRLLSDRNALGGFKNSTRTNISTGRQVAIATALGRVSHYSVETLANGDMKRRKIKPDGTVSEIFQYANGTEKTTQPDGTIVNRTLSPDPRFGMQAPFVSLQTVVTGGLTKTVSSGMSIEPANLTDPMAFTKLTQTESINGRTQTSVFDKASLTRTVTSAAGRQSYTKLDNLGRVIEAGLTGVEPYRFGYDQHGHLTSAAQGSGDNQRLTTIAYGDTGYLQSITNALNLKTSFSHDDAGRVTQQVLANTNQINFGYDAGSNLLSLQPPGQPEHSFAYNAVNQAIGYTPPDLGQGATATTYQTNLDKQLTQVLTPDLAAIDFDYNSAGQIKTLTIPEGIYQFAFDNAGRINQVLAPGNQELAFSFNGALLASAAWNGGISGSIAFTYDNDFRIANIKVNNANAISYQYDADSLLTQAGDLQYQRNADNGLLTGSTLANVYDAIAYNSFAEPIAYAADFNGAELFKQSFVRDKLGRITQKSETVDNATTVYDYSYDAIGQLVSVKRNNALYSSYQYDANGNRTWKSSGGQIVTGAYDAQDRLLVYGSAQYAYSKNGELRSKTVNGQTTQYQYDVLGNLRSVKLSDNTQIDYVIDGQNRRIGKKVNGGLVQGFLYENQLRPIAELDAAGNIVSRFVYGNRVNVPDYMIKGGVSYRIITDHLGSPRLIVDTATGNVVQKMAYDEFGRVLTDSNPGFQPFGFAGGLYERDTKLVRFGARDYDAEVGRWNSKDPIHFSGSYWNLYKYSANNPVNNIDVNGLLDFPAPSKSAWQSTAVGGLLGGGIKGAAAGAVAGYMCDIVDANEKQAMDEYNNFLDSLDELHNGATDEYNNFLDSLDKLHKGATDEYNNFLDSLRKLHNGATEEWNQFVDSL